MINPRLLVNDSDTNEQQNELMEPDAKITDNKGDNLKYKFAKNFF